jgi:hypothetical protein
MFTEMGVELGQEVSGLPAFCINQLVQVQPHSLWFSTAAEASNVGLISRR